MSHERLEKSSAKDAGNAAKRAAKHSKKKPEKLSRKEFEKEQEKLDVELVKLQLWVQKKGLKVIVVFEGRDAAGKGGVIKRITERVSPRVFRVVALPAPTEREKSQLYLQRYIPALSGGRRSDHIRSQLVQPSRRGAGNGILLRKPSQAIFIALSFVGAGRR